MTPLETLSLYAQAIGVNMTPMHDTMRAIGDALPEADHLFVSEHWQELHKFLRTERGRESIQLLVIEWRESRK